MQFLSQESLDSRLSIGKQGLCTCCDPTRNTQSKSICEIQTHSKLLSLCVHYSGCECSSGLSDPVCKETVACYQHKSTQRINWYLSVQLSSRVLSVTANIELNRLYSFCHTLVIQLLSLSSHYTDLIYNTSLTHSTQIVGNVKC